MTATAVVEELPTGELTMVEALGAALDRALATDPRVMLLGLDIGANGGVFRVTEGLHERYGGERVVDMPIAEAGTVGVAVGLCLAGYRPVVEIQFDSFSYPAVEQIATHVGRYRWRTRGSMAMPMVIRMPCGGGVGAPELHSESPEALFCHLPGLRVLCPSSPGDAFDMLSWAIASEDPVLLMEPKRLYRGWREPLSLGQSDAEPGAMVLHPGRDVTVVSYGGALPACAEAAALLDTEGVSVEIIDLRSLWPLDAETLISSVRRTRRCVVVHEAQRSCGVGAEVAALLAEGALFDLDAPVVRVTGLDAPYPLAALEAEYLPDAKRIADAVRRLTL